MYLSVFLSSCICLSFFRHIFVCLSFVIYLSVFLLSCICLSFIYDERQTDKYMTKERQTNTCRKKDMQIHDERKTDKYMTDERQTNTRRKKDKQISECICLSFIRHVFVCLSFGMYLSVFLSACICLSFFWHVFVCLSSDKQIHDERKTCKYMTDERQTNT
jgi:hypothetical protein